jgi:5-formyltetrahydrofolate cyclo-ligase
MTKQEIRKLYLQKRQSLDEVEFQRLNHLVCDQFFATTDLSSVRVLHAFLPIEKQKEVNTWLIIDRIKKEFPQLRIAIPKINNQSSTLESYFLEGRHQLEKNTWGIPEPKQGIPAPAEKIDMVLVPLVAFDKQGNRVGYGRGFYDKFLANCNADCSKIGLSLFPGVDNIEDINSRDLPLNRVITPREVISFDFA